MRSFFPINLLLTNKKSKLYLFAVLTLLLLVLLIKLALLFFGSKEKTIKYIAYVHQDHYTLDTLSNIVLAKYIQELNEKYKDKGFTLQLKPFSNQTFTKNSAEIYKKISRDTNYLLAIDNTFGKHLDQIAEIVRVNNFPVIALNGDKNNNDFGKNAVFVGHNDKDPIAISKFIRKILNPDSIIFIAESDYPLTKVYNKQFRMDSIKISEQVDIKFEATHISSEDSLIFVNKIKTILDSTKLKNPIVVINTHSPWGNVILDYFDKNEKGLRIICPIFSISTIKKKRLFDSSENELIANTSPADATPFKIANDLYEFQRNENHSICIKRSTNPAYFIERCYNATAILDCFLQNKPAYQINSDSLSKFFKLLNNIEIKTLSRALKFDPDLLLKSDYRFSIYHNGILSSFTKQLNNDFEVIPNLIFGVQIKSIYNINEVGNTFEADFNYWVRCDTQYINEENKINFSNIKGNIVDSKKLLIEEKFGSTVSRLYHVNGRFSSPLNFIDYPLDSNLISIDVDILNPTDELLISFDKAGLKEKFFEDVNFNLNGFHVDNSIPTVDDINKETIYSANLARKYNKNPYRKISLNVFIKRELLSPMVGIIIPILLIGIAALMILFLQDKAFANVGEVSVGLLVAIITSSIPLIQLTPNVGVIKRSDKVYLFTLAIVFCVFIFIIVRNSSLGRFIDVKIINKIGRNSFSVSFIIIGYIMLALLTLFGKI